MRLAPRRLECLGEPIQGPLLLSDLLAGASVLIQLVRGHPLEGFQVKFGRFVRFLWLISLCLYYFLKHLGSIRLRAHYGTTNYFNNNISHPNANY